MSMEANTIPKTLLKFTNSDYPISNSLSQSQSQRQRKEKEHLQCTQLPGKETKQVSSILTVWHMLKIKIKIHTLSWSSYYQKPLWETLSKRLLYLRDYYIKEPWVSGWIERKEENVKNTQIGPLIRYSNWDKIYVVACTCWSIQGNFLRYKYHHLAHLHAQIWPIIPRNKSTDRIPYIIS